MLRIRQIGLCVGLHFDELVFFGDHGIAGESGLSLHGKVVHLIVDALLHFVQG